MFKTLLEEIDSFFARDPAARSRLEIILCYPGLHAVLVYRATHWMWKENWKTLARFVSHLGRMLTGIEIHPGATIGKRFFIDHGMGVVIGETATIGDDVTIYHDVTLGGVSTGDAAKGTLRHPQIGDEVVIGSGAQLLGPITVGKGARIGSNAVVVKDVAENATMVGVPARDVTKRRKAGDEEDHEFAAYGIVHGELPDPMMEAMKKLIREIHHLKTRIKELEAQGEHIEETATQWEQKQ